MTTADDLAERLHAARASITARGLRLNGDPLGPWASNPLAHAARLTHLDRILDVSTAPSLFTVGDLPPYLASGLPPDLLLRLPWVARHHAAALHDRDAVRSLIHELGADDDYARLGADLRHGQPRPAHLTVVRLPAVDAAGHAAAAWTAHADHPAHADYAARIDSWTARGRGQRPLLASTPRSAW